MANILKIILIDDNPNDAEEINKTIKLAGFSVRPKYVSDADGLNKALAAESIDIVLVDLDHKKLSLKQVVKNATNLTNPPAIIAICKRHHHSIEKTLGIGATDQINFSNLEHLKQVIKRTFSTQQKAAELVQIKSVYGDLQDRCSAVLSKFEQPVAYLHDGIHVYANPAYLNLFALQSFDDLEGVPVMDLLPESEQKLIKIFLREHAEGKNEEALLDIKLIVANKPIDVTVECNDVFYDGEPCQQIIMQPISEPDASQIAAQLNYLSIYDISSGLYTHAHLIEQLEKIVDQEDADNPPRALILLSLNNYNELASALGMAETELLYATIGTHLKSHLSLDDLLCRYDTATFGLLTHGMDKIELFTMVPQLLSSINDQLFEIHSKSISAHLSAGASVLNGSMNNAYGVISQAYTALQTANRKGKAFEISRSRGASKSLKEIDIIWIEKLRLSLKNNLFRLLYQPILKLKNDGQERYTVSIRIADNKTAEGKSKFISPAEFLPSAERAGYANGIDRWVIMHAFEALKKQQSEGHNPMLFIKLTANTLYHEDDISWIRKQIEEHKTDPHHLAFEINTSSLTNHLQQTRRLIDDIKPLGCKIVIDDFGSSLNPFQVLKHVDIDYLKLDKNLIEDITHNDTHQRLVGRITKQAHDLGKEVIAQKVEEANQFFLLKELNTDYVQGYFLQRPRETLRYDFGVLI
jgi:diguanylate cyclase (GGDEF)-like protein